MLVTIFMMILLLIIAITFQMGKGSSFIAGYNTLPEEEKAQYDEIALTKFIGKIMYALVASMGFWLLSDWLEVGWLLYVGLGLFGLIIVFMIIYVNTGNRFKRK